MKKTCRIFTMNGDLLNHEKAITVSDGTGSLFYYEYLFITNSCHLRLFYLLQFQT